MPTDKPTEPQRGWFKVWCDGVVSAFGSGPYEMVKAEADHYALVYADNHTVKVRVQRIGQRKAP